MLTASKRVASKSRARLRTPEMGASQRVTKEALPSAFPVDTSPALSRLFDLYEKKEKPLKISFRQLVSWIKVGERATHYLHPYPAKLLPQIAHFFLAASSFVSTEDAVLDPFGGTGTVALETILSGRDSYFVDVNPLARLIARTKTRAVDIKELRAAYARVKTRYRRYKSTSRPDVVNLELWYSEEAVKGLGKIRRAIECEPASDVTDLLWVTFSVTARKASNADPRFSVPVRPNPKRFKPVSGVKPDAWTQFHDQFENNVRRQERLAKFGERAKLGHARCAGTDAKDLSSIKDGTVGLVITSPPYAGAQKYVRATSLSLGWLGLVESKGLRLLEEQTIGREHFSKKYADELRPTGVVAADRVIARVYKKNRTRAAIVSVYLNELASVITELARVTKSGGHVVLVIGDNLVCGDVFPSSLYLKEMFEIAGFATRLELVDRIPSRGLMTKRNATASVIHKECIIVLQRLEKL